MSRPILTTKYVRSVFSKSSDFGVGGDAVIEFNRWLAQHDNEVADKAITEYEANT